MVLGQSISIAGSLTLILRKWLLLFIGMVPGLQLLFMLLLMELRLYD